MKTFDEWCDANGLKGDEDDRREYYAEREEWLEQNPDYEDEDE